MIRVENLSKSYGPQVLFDDAGFAMTPGERLGLVGRNGHGKSTLFRLLLGEESLDAGSIVKPRDYRIGHLSQQLVFRHDTILDEVASVLGGRATEERYRAEAALMGLGFTRDDLSRPAGEFSGGYQIRVNLACLLVAAPNLLLLDEPTNYLDIVSLRWLARFLRKWRHELILITHDRRFMDSVTTHTMAIHRRKLRRMAGSLEKLGRQLASEEEVYENTRLNQQKQRRREQRFIERFRSKASKARVVQSRIKQLERRGQMEALDTEDELRFHFDAAPFHADTMLSVSGLRFGFPGGPTLIDGLDLELDKGDRVAIIGPNGKGKSTLLSLLAGELTPDAGRIRKNPNTRTGFFGQTHIDRLDAGNTVEQELLAARPEQTTTGVRSLCGLLMFSGDLAAKPVSVLSGGERSRVLLGKLLLRPANLLLLDEPTNHLDLESVEGLLDALEEFDGAVLIVTHDEQILERLATRLVVFDAGGVSLFQGGYTDFLERVGWSGEAEIAAARKLSARPKGRDLRRLRAEIVARRAKATAPLQRDVQRLEQAIERLEAEVAGLDHNMAVAAQQGANTELVRLATRAKAARSAIDRHFDELERKSDALDQARAGFDVELAELE